MKTCEECVREFPPHLVNLMTIAVPEGKGLRAEVMERHLCPVCALKIVNQIHGLPLETPFRGPRARQLYDEAMAHIRKARKDHR